MKIKVTLNYEFEIDPPKEDWDSADEDARNTYIENSLKEWVNEDINYLLRDSDTEYEILEK